MYHWKQQGMPTDADNRVTEAEARAWREERDEEIRQRRKRNSAALLPTRSDGVAGGEPAGLFDAQERYRLAKAEKEELALARIKGDLVPREEVAELLVTRATEFKRALEGMANDLPPHLAERPAKEVRARMREAVRRILERYSREA